MYIEFSRKFLYPPRILEGPHLLLSLAGSPSFVPLVGRVVSVLACNARCPGFDPRVWQYISSLRCEGYFLENSIYKCEYSSEDFNIFDYKHVTKAKFLSAKPPRISEGPHLLLSLVGSPSFVPLAGRVDSVLAYHARYPGFDPRVWQYISSLRCEGYFLENSI